MSKEKFLDSISALEQDHELPNASILFWDKLRNYIKEIISLNKIPEDRKAYLQINKNFFKNTPAWKVLMEHYRNENMNKVNDIVDKIGDLFLFEEKLTKEEKEIIKKIKFIIKGCAVHHASDLYIHYFTFLVANWYLVEWEDFNYFEWESFKDYEKYNLSLEEIREKFTIK